MQVQRGWRTSPEPRITLVFCNLRLGGIQRSMLTLASELLRRGIAVDVLVQRATGEHAAEAPAGCRVHEMRRSRMTLAERVHVARTYPMLAWKLLRPRLNRHGLPRLRRLKELEFLEFFAFVRDYLFRTRPRAVLSAEVRYNLLALCACSSVRPRIPVVVSEHNNLDASASPFWRDPKLTDRAVRLYSTARAAVGVSQGICTQLKDRGLAPHMTRTINNAVLGNQVLELAADEPLHPWLAQHTVPVLLSVGRIHPQKDLETLLRAFANLRTQRPCRLIVVGGTGGSCAGNVYLQSLRILCEELEIARDVDFIGFRSNPYAFLRRASLFVLSSRYEGLGNVVIEALACGCPVVSTDCAHGPREILDDGRYGLLVPVGDAAALARAMGVALGAPHNGESSDGPQPGLLRRVRCRRTARALARGLQRGAAVGWRGRTYG